MDVTSSPEELEQENATQNDAVYQPRMQAPQAAIKSGMAILQSRVQIGIEAVPITVEAHLSNGLPCFHLVGLPEKGVRESKERVRSAILNAGFRFPDRHITVNLAPAHLPKPDSHLDLAIALSILKASGQLPVSFAGHEFYGELALSGELRAIRHILAAAMGCEKAGRCLIAAKRNAVVAAQVKGLRVKSADSLLAVCNHLMGQQSLPSVRRADCEVERQAGPVTVPDIGQVYGQPMAKRAMVLAAAGGHNVVLRGPPGTGKTLLANCLIGLLPAMDAKDQMQAMLVHAMRDLWCETAQRPFRQPHHSASYAAMVGGGHPVMPGEISLAHGGVLFLDEMHEFKPSVLNSLREPLESGCIHLARAGVEFRFPARFMLVGACNPCPCGYWGQARCECAMAQVQRYQQRVSGPLWDRIDLVVDMQPSQMHWEQTAVHVPESPAIQAQVQQCHDHQLMRQGCSNATLTGALLALPALQVSAKASLRAAAEGLGLSVRATHRVVRVARTIADLALSDTIETVHIQEALSYRLSDGC